MPILAQLAEKLRLPVIAAPMFLVSGVDLVIAQCKAGIVGSFPSLNARPAEQLTDWIQQIKTELAGTGAAPFAVNLIAHPTNARFEQDAQVCVDHQVPLLLTSLHPPGDLARAVHGYGGLVFHDVTNVRHAEKAVEQGVDGLVLVCAGAGGHAGTLSPFALLPEIRRFYDGPIVLAGAISSGRAIAAAQLLGADLTYLGTRFIATDESNAVAGHKDMVVDSTSADVVHTPYFSGVPANYLTNSILAAGIDLAELAAPAEKVFRSGSRHEVKAWRDIWGAGQGVGSIDAVLPVAEVVKSLITEYEQAGREPRGASHAS